MYLAIGIREMIFDYYKDIQLAQTPGAKEVIKEAIQHFDTIIEIGFLHGGLSLWIQDHKPYNSKFIAIDINNINKWQGKSTPTGGENIDFRILDCFAPDGQQFIANELKNTKALLLCDGSHKNNEFNYYSQFLSRGSAILLHDYIDDSKDSEYWNYLARTKDWTAPPESQFSRIKNSIDKYSLKPFMYNELLNVFWGGFIK